MNGGQSRPSGRLNASVGALATLAGAFFLSAMLRAGDVIAALPGTVDDGFGNAVPQGEGAAARRPVLGETDDLGDGALELVAELRQRREALQVRETALEERSQTLEAVEARLRERLEELEAARKRLEQTAVLVDDAAEQDVRHLAEMYEQMKPKQAAEIFNQMPPSFAAGFLGQMDSASAALVMANMEAEKAYAVSLLLAGRNVGRGER